MVDLAAFSGIALFLFPYALGLATLYFFFWWYSPEALPFLWAGLKKKDLLAWYTGNKRVKYMVADLEDDKSIFFVDEKKNKFKINRSHYDARGYNIAGAGRTAKRVYNYFSWLLPSDATQIVRINRYIDHIRDTPAEYPALTGIEAAEKKTTVGKIKEAARENSKRFPLLAMLPQDHLISEYLTLMPSQLEATAKRVGQRYKTLEIKDKDGKKVNLETEFKAEVLRAWEDLQQQALTPGPFDWIEGFNAMVNPLNQTVLNDVERIAQETKGGLTGLLAGITPDMRTGFLVIGGAIGGIILMKMAGGGL
ncbi:hypothetical protein [Methanocella sp. MCL-LM]|uniref:hypothetical protein n=1 Tax=Methanocella sp. MCL-LM TaxID=3412035 RepID=UPI003C784B7F